MEKETLQLTLQKHKRLSETTLNKLHGNKLVNLDERDTLPETYLVRVDAQAVACVSKYYVFWGETARWTTLADSLCTESWGDSQDSCLYAYEQLFLCLLYVVF